MSTPEARGYVVTIMDGPATDWSYIAFVPPDETIYLVPINPAAEAEHGKWMRVPSDWPHMRLNPNPAPLVYKRDELPTEVNDTNITVDGDWFVAYTFMGRMPSDTDPEAPPASEVVT